jgi:transposase
MLIIGCDYHPAFQQIAFVDTETGSCKSGDWSTLRQRRSSTVIWRPREAECAWRWKPVDMRWFERLLAELNFELWIGDATEIARKREQAEDRSPGCARHSALAAER